MVGEWSGRWGVWHLLPLGKGRFHRSRGLMGPRLVWRDLRRTVQGAVAFLRYLRSPETINIALGLFEAASSAVVVGQPCRYVIRIANVSEKVWDVKLTVEISSCTPANAAAKPYASFTKHCTVLLHSATEIEFHYDWRTTSVFMVDKVASFPDEFWMGEIKTLQRYVVSAILCDHTGKHLDKLDIYQELQG
jgi:hypothetical protein